MKGQAMRNTNAKEPLVIRQLGRVAGPFLFAEFVQLPVI